MYRALLELGPSTGYAVARAAGYARANAYAALAGLLRRGAAQRGGGRPARYRATDPHTLLVQLSGELGERLERLARAVAGLQRPAEPVTRSVEGSRAIANVVQQLVARATQRVQGVVASELWPPTLPAWRHAARHATLQIRISGDAPDPEGLAAGRTAAGGPTILVADDQFALAATGSGPTMTAVWSGHPLVVLLARSSLGVPF